MVLDAAKEGNKDLRSKGWVAPHLIKNFTATAGSFQGDRTPGASWRHQSESIILARLWKRREP